MAKVMIKRRQFVGLHNGMYGRGLSWGPWKSIGQSKTVEEAESLAKDVKPGLCQIALFQGGKKVKMIRE